MVLYKPAVYTLSVVFLTVAMAIGAALEIPPPDKIKAQIGHLPPVPVPDDNPLTEAKVRLGEKLFTDTGLAGDGSLSCQSCHLPNHGFAVPQALGPAYPSQTERRHSPTLVNVAYSQPLIWDGRAPNLDKQALGPVKNILHLNNNLDLLVERLKGNAEYRQMFKAAFGDEAITELHIAQALASFERSLVFDNSPLDHYMDGDVKALSEAQQRGLALFLGKANCVACHKGPNLTDNQFHNLGVPDEGVTRNPAAMASLRFDAKRMEYPDWEALEHDPGRALVSKKPEDFGKFRTMGLRNIEQSPPYMHNGALNTLDEVVQFYNRGGGEVPNKSPLMRPLGLTDQEIGDLVAFMQALTGARREFKSP